MAFIEKNKRVGKAYPVICESFRNAGEAILPVKARPVRAARAVLQAQSSASAALRLP